MWSSTARWIISSHFPPAIIRFLHEFIPWFFLTVYLGGFLFATEKRFSSVYDSFKNEAFSLSRQIASSIQSKEVNKLWLYSQQLTQAIYDKSLFIRLIQQSRLAGGTENYFIPSATVECIAVLQDAVLVKLWNATKSKTWNQLSLLEHCVAPASKYVQEYVYCKTGFLYILWRSLFLLFSVTPSSSLSIHFEVYVTKQQIALWRSYILKRLCLLLYTLYNLLWWNSCVLGHISGWKSSFIVQTWLLDVESLSKSEYKGLTESWEKVARQVWSQAPSTDERYCWITRLFWREYILKHFRTRWKNF